MTAFRNAQTLIDRISALPEPYQTNLIEWFRCGLDWSIHAPCEGLVRLEDLLRTAPLGHLVQLKQVLAEAERYFGGVQLVMNSPVRQTIFATSS
ncbi:MAG: hypothetical protein HY870_16130 [Chloroflexi bacterium]|nr:hypothetical protein [Chloroflexota bacterium]